MATRNRQLRLAQRPVGMVDDDTFELVESDAPELNDGEALVRMAYLSIDPTNRVWIREEPSYLPPVEIGEVMRGGGVGKVIESRSDTYPVGATVTGMLGWQEHAVVGADVLARVVPDGVPMMAVLNVLGSSGMTAYFGMTDIAQAREGDTVVISGAAGSVGSLAGQIGKILGCQVIGIAGTDEKCAWVTEDLGFDACINYKTEDVAKRLDELCPDGIDVYFDNVGGTILDEALARLALNARVAMCGTISSYNESGLPESVHNYFKLIATRSRMEGFLVLDYLDRFDEGAAKLLEWTFEGRLQAREQIVDGLENAPRALNMLFTGENTGKLLVKVDPDAD
ncbi:MAG: NADP-dependent oxidoreductase [Acidimicrobiia bacterium]